MKIDLYLDHNPLLVGTLFFEVKGNREVLSFQYSERWLADKDAFSIDPALPLHPGPTFKSRVGNSNSSLFFGAIADTEPDGWGRKVILRSWAKEKDKKKAKSPTNLGDALNSMDFLLLVDDFSRIGALRYRIDNGPFIRTFNAEENPVPPLIKLQQLFQATEAFERNDESAKDLKFLIGQGTSLGGVRPKCSIIEEDGSLSIAKFPSISDDRAVTKGEVLALQLAKRAGIRVAESRIVFTGNDVPVAVIKRFDRIGDSRKMYVSAATLLELENASEGVHSYTEIVEGIRKHGGDKAGQDIEELWRRLIFNILINNIDDHLKNHGFLWSHREHWRLSPAFDLNPFPGKARELKTWITEDSGPEASISIALANAQYFGLTNTKAKKIITEVKDAVKKWRDLARHIGMTKLEIDQFPEAFEYKE